ncbi:SIN3-HDAC complex-associated factor [Tetranychus urticae]|uniref:Protein FAM60A n=1 Tax=Tetranychus urticae TaxID=32264 RepID=T1K3I6_TETUR|nr:SIN3-HDAC complex-associated factor [Tetranychus urticae]XP_015781913.1 SIN3-HDAC complex-associated factor [Tetranychus urticae]XP_015781914.1 SIN3-HDAC complex-associated factor [Tetranychus urticae]XP_015781915.1 SIN3-HDAC complex-associated factor [Tetranychus urticae]
MFSFHKPKIYRSISGCCICKAKSSSSRFTDSKKYEAEFEKCFRISEKRSGEICNACVLLVKRWKKLPPGTARNWRHVVDARAGPGTKSMKYAKLNHSNSSPLTSSTNAKKHQKPKKLKSSLIDFSDIQGDNFHVPSRRIPSPIQSDSSDLDGDSDEDDYLSDLDDEGKEQGAEGAFNSPKKKLRSSSKSPISNGLLSPSSSSSTSRRNLAKRTKPPTSSLSKVSSFLDMSFWRKEKICCGIIFKGPNNELLIYPKLLKPCSCRLKMTEAKSNSTGSGASDTASITSTSQIEEDTNSNASSTANYSL